MVIVPATTGQMGVFPGHVATIAELKPGILSVHEGNDMSKYFLSSWFAFIHANSVVDIIAVEATPVDCIDPDLVQKGLAEFQLKLNSASTDGEKAEAQIGCCSHRLTEVNLRHALGGMLSDHHRITQDAAEERVTKKLRERELELQENMNKNLELKEMEAHYKAEKEKVHDRVKFLEQVTKSLQSRLRDAVEARRYAETPQDDAQSSFTDPDSVRPVKLECKVCEERVAMVMMWLCRHVCVCVQCDAAVKECPVCGSVKRTSVEVRLPS